MSPAKQKTKTRQVGRRPQEKIQHSLLIGSICSHHQALRLPREAVSFSNIQRISIGNENSCFSSIPGKISECLGPLVKWFLELMLIISLNFLKQNLSSISEARMTLFSAWILFTAPYISGSRSRAGFGTGGRIGRDLGICGLALNPAGKKKACSRNTYRAGVVGWHWPGSWHPPKLLTHSHLQTEDLSKGSWVKIKKRSHIKCHYEQNRLLLRNMKWIYY